MSIVNGILSLKENQKRTLDTDLCIVSPTGKILNRSIKGKLSTPGALKLFVMRPLDNAKKPVP